MLITKSIGGCLASSNCFVNLATGTVSLCSAQERSIVSFASSDEWSAHKLFCMCREIGVTVEYFGGGSNTKVIRPSGDAYGLITLRFVIANLVLEKTSSRLDWALVSLSPLP